MKKIVICIVLLLSGLRLLAAGQEQEPYFCTRPGTELYYERTKAGKTKLLQTTLFEIESARPSAKGLTIRYAVTLTKANGSELYGGRAVQTAYASPDGDISLNFGETVKAFVRNLFPRTHIEVSEASAILPAQMQPGDTLPETHCTAGRHPPRNPLQRESDGNHRPFRHNGKEGAAQAENHHPRRNL